MAAELKIGIGADNSGLKQGLQDAEAQISAFVSKVGKIGQIGEQLSSIGQKMSVGLTLPILALGGSAIKAYGDLQSLEMGLKAVMGSGAEATKELEKLREVAKLPGLGLKEAVKGSVSLQAAGFSANEARRSLMAFGNALATVGKGANELSFVNLALTQIQNKTSGFGQDLRQLTEQLPQLRGAMQAAFGTADSEKVAELGYTGKEVVKMLTDEFSKLPKVTGGIKNAFENLGDSIFINMARIGKVIDDNFDISGIIDKLTGYLDTAISYFEGLSPAVQKTILVVTGLVAAAGPLLTIVGGFIAALPTMLTGLGALKVGFMALTGPIGLVVVGIGAIIAAVVSNWSKITPYLTRTANNFIQLYNESQTFRTGILSIGFAFESLYAVIKSFAKSAWQTLINFGKGVLNLFEGVSLMIRGAFNQNPEMISQGWSKANEKVVMSFDNVGLAIDKVYKKYDKLGKNEKPLKFVTEADLNISGDKVAEKTEKSVVNGATKSIKKANDKLKTVQIELPDIEPIQGKMNLNFIDDFGNEVENFWNIEDANNKLFEQMKQTGEIMLAGLNNVRNIAAVELELLKAEFNEAFATLINENIYDSILGGLDAIGESIANGGNVLSAVGKSLLSSVGGFLSELGGMMMKFGLAATVFGKLQAAFIAADPASKIGLGIAMVAAGALLRVAGSAVSSLASGKVGGGGSVPSGGGGSQSYSSNYSSNSGSMSGNVVFRIHGNDLVGVLDRATDRNTRIGGGKS